jgi:thiol-disulfide isomerase/thioredoxin
MNNRWMWLAGLAIALVLAYYFYQRLRLAPDVDFGSMKVTTLDGNPTSIAEIGSRKAIVCFAASWCGPCRKELSDLVRIKNDLEGAEVVVIGDETPDRIRMFKSLGNFPFTFYRLESTFASVGIRSIPTTYLVNAKGKVKMKRTGVIDWMDQSTRIHLLRLLEQ